jgi:integrase
MAGRIEKRGKNSWRLIAYCGYDGDGKQIRKIKTVTVGQACEKASCKECQKEKRCQARREAEKLLAEFVIEVEKGMFIEPTRLTFNDFSERWLRDYGEQNLAPKTLHRYKQLLETRIFPAMGHLKIEKITPVHLMDFYKNLTEDGIREDGKKGGLSERTILHHHRLIATILNAAVQWQIINSNPASRVKPPRVPKKQVAAYDVEETIALLVALEKEKLKHRVLIYLAMFTGLRRGEIMGLEWKDINIDEKVLRVHQAGQYIPGQGSFTKAPKNESSERLISLPAFLVDMLRQYRKEQAEHRLKVGDLWQGSDRLFTTWDGKPGHPEWPSQWFPKFIKRHNLSPLSFHGLRHTAATILINLDVPLKNISGRFGHAEVSTTGDIYSHFLQSADKAIADKLENFYQQITKEMKRGRA